VRFQLSFLKAKVRVQPQLWFADKDPGSIQTS
jgi:hypothetical protein